MELHDEENMTEDEKQEERDMMSMIYEDVIEIIERVLRECYLSLQVMTVIPLPDKEPVVTGANVALVRDLKEAEPKVKGGGEDNEKGFIPLTRVRWLLGTPNRSAAERETHHLMSED
eukprot:gene9459-10272_t